MKRFWCCRDLEGAANEEVFLFVGEEPPIMDDDGEWVLAPLWLPVVFAIGIVLVLLLILLIVAAIAACSK